MSIVTGPERRYTAYAGFVTTPKYFDDSPQQFLEVAPEGVGVIQRVNHIPDYEYELGERAKNFDLLEESAICLGQSFCEVVGQVGSNWVHCNGTTPDDIDRIQDEIGDKANTRFLMAGMCLVYALRELGAKKIAVANGYYRDDWRDGINRFLTQAGFEILSSGNLIDYGLYDSYSDLLAIESATLWDYPAKDVVRACHAAHVTATDADVVVQTGAGFRTMPYIESIEGLCGKPLVSSDMALYWAMLKHLGLRGRHRDFGHLMRTLA